MNDSNVTRVEIFTRPLQLWHRTVPSMGTLIAVSEVGGGVTADVWCRRRFQLVLTVFSLVRPPDYHFQELITKVDPLLFVKLYDPEKEDMRYAGRLLLKGISEPTEILSKLGEMAGYAPYEVVHFRSLDKPKEEGFCLELYVQKLELDDPSVIRLTSQNCYSKQPELLSIKYRAVDNLVDILVHYNWVEFSHPDAELRLLEVFYHKIYKVKYAPNCCTNKGFVISAGTSTVVSFSEVSDQ